MRVVDDIAFEIDRATVFSQLHLSGDGQYAAEVDVLIDRARELARPRALYKNAVVQRRESEAVVITEALAPAPSAPMPSPAGRPRKSPPPCNPTAGNPEAERVRFESRALRRNLDEVERVFPYVATCGIELDSIPVAGDDVFGQFCRDAIKEMALWAAISGLYVHLAETYGVGALASMNPGSGEAKVWPIEQQKRLFGFLGDVRESIGVTLTQSCLMVPNKSVSGIFYPSDDGFETCQLCRQERCSHRRTPFDPQLWERMFGEAP
jgi:hypothetical protein